MPLSDGDPITQPVLATAADLVRHAAPGQARILVDSVGRRVTITCHDVGRDWLQALAASGASGSLARPSKGRLAELKRDAVERAVLGALQSCIHEHGAITADMLTSATKRVVGNLANVANG
jgi:hypothetical protein